MSNTIDFQRLCAELPELKAAYQHLVAFLASERATKMLWNAQTPTRKKLVRMARGAKPR